MAEPFVIVISYDGDLNSAQEFERQNILTDAIRSIFQDVELPNLKLHMAIKESAQAVLDVFEEE